MKEGWAEGLSKDCPSCGVKNLPHYGHVTKNDVIRLDYRCEDCGHAYIRRDEPQPKVEILHQPGRPRK